MYKSTLNNILYKTLQNYHSSEAISVDKTGYACRNIQYSESKVKYRRQKS